MGEKTAASENRRNPGTPEKPGLQGKPGERKERKRPEKPLLLVSACLCGQAVRYDGRSCPVPALCRLAEEGLARPFCPECAGGLPTPRLPAECRGSRVFHPNGADCTAALEAGARLALSLCREQGLTAAVLKENSPSCGTHWIYDGSFTGRKTAGMGVAARLLRQAGVQVFSEREWEDAVAAAARASTVSLNGRGTDQAE